MEYNGLQVHHDLWHHTRLGRQHSWFPGAATLEASEVNGTQDSGAFTRAAPGHDIPNSSASTQHAPVRQVSIQLLALCLMHDTPCSVRAPTM